MTRSAPTADNLAAPGAEPLFPPRLRGEQAKSGQRPVDLACQRAAAGIDAGLIVWAIDAERVEAAVVLAPEQPLAKAIGVVLAVENALSDAIGSLAPPEVAVHFDWPGGLRLNGGQAGTVTARAATTVAEEEPDWLIVAISVDIIPRAAPTGDWDSDVTGLMAEGCAEVSPVALIESWSRHMLVWLNRFESEGMTGVHRDWHGRAWRMGDTLPKGHPDGPGLFVGIDEDGGMLVRAGEETTLVPLTVMLTRP